LASRLTGPASFFGSAAWREIATSASTKWGRIGKLEETGMAPLLSVTGHSSPRGLRGRYNQLPRSRTPTWMPHVPPPHRRSCAAVPLNSSGARQSAFGGEAKGICRGGNEESGGEGRPRGRDHESGSRDHAAGREGQNDC